MLQVTRAFALALGLMALPLAGALAQSGGSGGSGSGGSESTVPPSTTSGPGGLTSSQMPNAGPAAGATGTSAYVGPTHNATEPGRPPGSPPASAIMVPNPTSPQPANR